MSLWPLVADGPVGVPPYFNNIAQLLQLPGGLSTMSSLFVAVRHATATASFGYHFRVQNISLTSSTLLFEIEFLPGSDKQELQAKILLLHLP